jgi:tRNA(fMet)-specific endonuclease VapC
LNFISALKSNNPEESFKGVDAFIQGLEILPIFAFAKLYAKEKARFQKIGKPVNDEFDLIIGVTAKYYDLILVTENIKDLQNFENLKFQNWIKR